MVMMHPKLHDVPQESGATEVRADGYNILMIRKHGKLGPLSPGEGNKEGRAR
jgi:hypothetical protein